MGQLDGKIALITGGARGQGRSHARTLAAEGADIVIADLCADLPHVPYNLANDDDMAHTVRMVEDLDRRCVAVKADVSTSSGAKLAADTALAEFGKVDILVLNHGICGGGVYTWEIEEELWDEQVRVNLTALYLMVKLIIPQMIERRSGNIIMTSSLAGIKGLGHITPYTAAKHGVIGLMRALANEAAEYDIRVNAICPTAVDSPMLDNQFNFELFGGPGGTREDELAGTLKMNALNVALIDVQDISNMVLFLASEASRYVTGSIHPVDAGADNRFP